MNRDQVRLTLLAVFISVCVTGCASKERPVLFQSTGIHWPEEPEAARLEYLGEFASPEDLGIRPSLFSRLLWFSTGAAKATMLRPMDVAVTADEKRLFVADPGAHCVHVFDVLSDRYDCLKEGGGLQLRSPVGLAITSEGKLFVTDSELGEVFVLEPGERRLRRLSLSEDLKQPTGIAWSQVYRWLYVTDTGSHSVKVFSEDGGLVSEFARRGDQFGELNFPTYAWANNEGEVLVTDSLNFRIQRFSPQGESLSIFGKAGRTSGAMARPKGVAEDRHGHIYVTDGMLHALQIFDNSGRLLLAVGNRGHSAGEFWLPGGLFVSMNDLIWVADSYNRRVQVFRLLGGDE